MAWLQDEPGAALVEEHLLAARKADDQACFISIINLGEVYYWVARKRGEAEADRLWRHVGRRIVPLTRIDATRRRVREAAALKGRYPIAYADAFALQLAKETTTSTAAHRLLSWAAPSSAPWAASRRRSPA
jgi:hypothetical protein